MGLLSSLGFGSGVENSSDMSLPEIFSFMVTEKNFVDIDVQNIYSRILIDVLERTEGIKDENKVLLWDNCVASEKSDGLVSLISKSMVKKSELYIVYHKATGVIREADSAEKAKIKSDYTTNGKSDLGYAVTFTNYSRTDMLRLYSALEYCSVSSLHKSMNLSKAIQIKISNLRGSVGLGDSEVAETQAKAIAKGLSDGKDVALDADDSIETTKPDLEATTKSLDFISRKQSFYLGLPASYITGLAKGGLSDMSDSEKAAVERGLKPYYFSIIKPVIEAIFGEVTTFKTEDYKSMTSSLEALKTFELTTDELLSSDDKKKIISRMFDVET